MSANKYKKGEFGYWWTVTEGHEDIEGGDLNGGVNASSKGLTSLRGAPRSVSGNFWCHFNQLTSLEHCPKSVGDSFLCYSNQLTSLEYCPQKVRGNFLCNDNQLTDLTHAPREVGRSFECKNNQIGDTLSEIIAHGIIASYYQVTGATRITFDEVEAEKQRRANIKRQLGPFAITIPGGKI